MEVFGDESGHLRNLLSDNCPQYVLGVVAGDITDCIACPKKSVRQVGNIAEARWSDLNTTQKRRFIDCLATERTDVTFAYVTFEKSDLVDLEHSYLLHQNDGFPYDWDLCVTGYAYAELLHHIGATELYDCFTFDTFISSKQSDRIAHIIQDEEITLPVESGSSRQVKGIQAADCFAGAVSDHHQGDESWLDSINENRIIDATDYALCRIEKELYEIGTGP